VSEHAAGVGKRGSRRFAACRSNGRFTSRADARPRPLRRRRHAL